MQLVEREHRALHVAALPVAEGDIGTPKLGRIITALRKTLAAEEDGVAIAAPQIGVSLRLFVVSGRVFDPGWQEAAAGETKRPRAAAEKKPVPHAGDMVFINPRIVRRSKELKPMVEGCLSLRWLYGTVLRASKVTLEAYDENGKRVRRGAGGLLAQIFQHETDHLDGVLFTDKATEVENLPPEGPEHGA